MSAGRLFGVGVGPGDPELMTLKARRVIEGAEVIAYPVARHGRSVSRAVAAPFLRPEQLEVALTYPVTTEETDHPGGYEGALKEFYERSAVEIAGHLDAGRDVAVLCEGDPFFYGSYMYLHERLAARYETEVVPGVTSFSAAAAAAGVPLAKRDDVLSILPGTLPPDVLAARLSDCDAAVVMKLGRRFDAVRGAAERAGTGGIYVERASTPEQRVAPLAKVEGEVPYMSLLLIPTASRRERRAASLAVVGLGPGGPEWLTPEARSELAGADELVGYGTYLDRVPARPGQRRHATDNRVEADRARHALELAAGGAHVAVVSSGDPGIFAMASAVLEEYERGNGQYAGVDLRVIPGMSAMQAAAARVGAPLGHDFCVLSLSDILKPWAIVERRLRAAGAADLALALYNPASRTRREQLARALELLREYRAPETPVVVARSVGGDAESVTVTTLADVAPGMVDMRTLVIVGSSTTRVLPGDPPRVYTPRRYPAPS